jgi:hypothetical protein
MALIVCRDCGRSVSDAASSCPNCGRPVAGLEEPFSPALITAFLRSVVHAALSPSTFMDRWTASPERYAPPKRLIMANALVAGLSVTALLWWRPSGLPSVSQKILAATTSITTPWITVITTRWAGQLIRRPMDWIDATRLAAFGSASGVVFTPIVLAFMLFSRMSLASAVSAALSLVYGTYAFRSLTGTWKRAIGGAVASFGLASLVSAVLFGVLGTALAAAGFWIPDLRMVDVPAALDAGARDAAVVDAGLADAP